MMELIHVHHMEILFVCEPRISGSQEVSVVKWLPRSVNGFPCCEIIDPVGFSRGSMAALG